MLEKLGFQHKLFACFLCTPGRFSACRVAFASVPSPHLQGPGFLFPEQRVLQSPSGSKAVFLLCCFSWTFSGTSHHFDFLDQVSFSGRELGSFLAQVLEEL